MFDMSLSEHLRLTFGQVAYRQRAHLEQAQRLSRRETRLRALELILILITGAAATAAFLRLEERAALATVVAAGLTLLVALWRLVMTSSSLIYAHRACSGRLWLIREKYRGLLSDLSDGTIDAAAASRRRDALMEEFHALYENAPEADKRSYKRARRALSGTEEVPMSDEDIDFFLPKSLRKSEQSSQGVGTVLGRTV